MSNGRQRIGQVEQFDQYRPALLDGRLSRGFVGGLQPAITHEPIVQLALRPRRQTMGPGQYAPCSRSRVSASAKLRSRENPRFMMSSTATCA